MIGNSRPDSTLLALAGAGVLIAVLTALYLTQGITEPIDAEEAFFGMLFCLVLVVFVSVVTALIGGTLFGQSYRKALPAELRESSKAPIAFGIGMGLALAILPLVSDYIVLGVLSVLPGADEVGDLGDLRLMILLALVVPVLTLTAVVKLGRNAVERRRASVSGSAEGD